MRREPLANKRGKLTYQYLSIKIDLIWSFETGFKFSCHIECILWGQFEPNKGYELFETLYQDDESVRKYCLLKDNYFKTDS